MKASSTILEKIGRALTSPGFAYGSMWWCPPGAGAAWIAAQRVDQRRREAAATASRGA